MIFIPQPWRWVFRACGISPRGNQKDKLFSAIGICIWLGHGVQLFLNRRDNRFGVMRWIIVTIYHTSIFVFLALNHIHPESNIELERDLRRTNKELRELCDVKIGASAISKNFIVWTSFQLIIPLAYSLVIPVPIVAQIWLGHLIACMPLLQQVLLVNLVHDRFLALNNHLARTIIGRDTTAILDKAFRIHSNLHALVADIDARYCFYILLTFISIFLTWIHNMYNILLAISGTADASFYVNQYRVILVTSYFLLLALDCHSCSQAANRSVMIAHRLLQPNTDPSIWDQVRMFSAMVTDNKVHFTIGSIFKVDRALVTKTALTALSYLLIAIQMKDVEIFGGDLTTVTSLATI